MKTAKFVHTFIESDSGIFLQHRDDIQGIYDPNQLCAYGGHIDKDDESPRTAAIRELIEETGIIADPAQLSFKGITRKRELDLAGNNIRKVVYGYSINIPYDKDVPCYEGQQTVFVAFGSNILKVAFDISDITLHELRRFYLDRFIFDK